MFARHLVISIRVVVEILLIMEKHHVISLTKVVGSIQGSTKKGKTSKASPCSLGTILMTLAIAPPLMIFV